MKYVRLLPLVNFKQKSTKFFKKKINSEQYNNIVFDFSFILLYNMDILGKQYVCNTLDGNIDLCITDEIAVKSAII